MADKKNADKKNKAIEVEEGIAVRSEFISHPDGLETSISDASWDAVESGVEFQTPEGAAELNETTEIRFAHDARTLACQITCSESDMSSLRELRNGEIGRLDLDDSVEILLDPYGGGFKWSILVNPTGEVEVITPVGATGIGPTCKVEVAKTDDAWTALLLIPIVQVGLEGDLRSTPINGETWGMAAIRRRHTDKEGLREVAVYAKEVSLNLTAADLERIQFRGGRDTNPINFTRYTAGSYGVSEICVAFEDGKIPKKLDVNLVPPPAKQLRSKDKSRYKFRAARPGLYRFTTRIPYTPPPEPTEEELDAWEREMGRELTDDEFTERIESRPGSPEFIAGLSFVLKDIWSRVEMLEDTAEIYRERLIAAGIEIDEKTEECFERLFHQLREIDRYRAPHIKTRLLPEHLAELENTWLDLRELVRGRLLRSANLSVASPYLAEGSWLLGALRVKPGKGKTAAALKKAGLDFVGFSERAEDVGKKSKLWDKAEEGLSVLRNLEVGPHYTALCVGLPEDGLNEASGENYDAINATNEAGGFAIMCSALEGLATIPAELKDVSGIDINMTDWERLNAESDHRLIRFPGSVLDGASLKGDALPERSVLLGVIAKENTPEAVVDALKRGSFYTTTATGPRIKDVELEGDTITIHTTEPCQFVFRNETGAVLSGAYGETASYRFTGREKYVRVLILSEVLEDGFRLEAQTQPFYLADDLPSSTTEDDWTIAKGVERAEEVVEEPEPEPVAPQGATEAEEAEEEEVEDDEDVEYIEEYIEEIVEEIVEE